MGLSKWLPPRAFQSKCVLSPDRKQKAPLHIGNYLPAAVCSSHSMSDRLVVETPTPLHNPASKTLTPPLPPKNK